MKIFVPSDMDDEQALAETTHLAISAHQDDIEFMAYDGILKCFGSSENHFTAAIATNGAGSPRSGIYASFSDEEMQNVRIEEQKKAAIVGEYSAQVFLDFPSSAIKEKGNREAIDSIKEVIKKTTPKVIYTHNLADKHDTHVGVVLKVITALRELDYKVDALYGCEVWRGLDWVCDDEKVLFDVAGRPNLEASLLGVFDSQISGGKRYDLAVVGRRLANATFGQSHGVDETTGVIYGMDLTPLIDDPNSSIDEYIKGYINRFSDDITDKIRRMI